MDSSSGQIEGGRFFPIQHHQITDDNILDDSEAIATPAPGLHKLRYPGIRDMSTWSKFGAHGEHGDVFLFSNLGAL